MSPEWLKNVPDPNARNTPHIAPYDACIEICTSFLSRSKAVLDSNA